MVGNLFPYVEAPPAKCNHLLAEGQIHAAPSSSIEYAAHWKDYCISPQFCTASKQSIGSVLLCSNQPWEQISDVLLSPQSETSVCLLDILFKKMRGKSAILQPNSIPQNPENLPEFLAELHIGDNALRESQSDKWKYCYDLAQIWNEWQQLPFVFGLWIFKNDFLDENQKWHQKLEESVISFEENPSQAYHNWTKNYPSPLNQKEALEYFSKINYRLGDKEIQSLKKFFQFAFECGYISELPEIQFLKI